MNCRMYINIKQSLLSLAVVSHQQNFMKLSSITASLIVFLSDLLHLLPALYDTRLMKAAEDGMRRSNDDLKYEYTSV